jgi:hypothetical protein
MPGKSPSNKRKSMTQLRNKEASATPAKKRKSKKDLPRNVRAKDSKDLAKIWAGRVMERGPEDYSKSGHGGITEVTNEWVIRDRTADSATSNREDEKTEEKPHLHLQLPPSKAVLHPQLNELTGKFSVEHDPRTGKILGLIRPVRFCFCFL